MNQTMTKNLDSRLKQMEGELRSDIQSTTVELSSINHGDWHDTESRAEMIVSQELALELKERQTIRLLRIQRPQIDSEWYLWPLSKVRQSDFRGTPPGAARNVSMHALRAIGFAKITPGFLPSESGMRGQTR